ncbi:GNAT family N-acetyltransferase [Streptomyces bambusae]|uniref:GNAT family N-acetyltransferase n=1 Tax=Streptomyces bambusae TaxID=1550616 RepID=UPI001CFD9B59|nr:GNAT family N-acetyltransferase [Streptomyces bambusae]MCB5166916.1 GNAT family N-acetyltransferase [Streptomyces bambusae]
MLTVRPARAGDAPDICALMNAVDLVEIGRAETELAEVEADLLHPEMDLERDSWLAFEDGRPVAYACLWCDGDPERIDTDHYALPGHPEAAERLLALMEARALERAREAGAVRAVVHLNLNIAPTTDPAVLTRRGWERVRRYHVMTRPVSVQADPLPEPPAGLTLRDCTDEADRRIAHALHMESFTEHFDHQPRTYEQWLADLGATREDMDWSLVWIANAAGQGDVGVCISKDNRAAMGWVRSLGVRKGARGRGVAGFLLRHAFAVYAARGRDTLGLGVDTRNETGALRLYEAHGMGPHYAVDTWETVLD